MFAIEKRLLDLVRRHILLIGVIVVSAGTLLMRLWMRSYMVGDMEVFLIPWMRTIREEGWKASLHLPDNNYNVAYMLVLWVFSLVPVTDMMAVKLASIFFDYVGAFAMGWAVLALVSKEQGNRRLLAAGAFIGTLLLPIPLANSALWGQCDMMYTVFLLLCAVQLMRGRYTGGFIWFGVALCFKLQAVFFLPVLLVLYFTKRGFTVLQFLWVPALVFLLGLLGRYKGDSLFYGFTVYAGQVGEDTWLYRAYPNIFALFQEQDYSTFALPAVVFTLLVFGCMLVYLLQKGWTLEGDGILLFGVWSVLTCCMFLPAMHDRYGFAAELLVWLFFLLRPTLKRFCFALAVNFVPVMVYVKVFVLVGYTSQATASILNILAYLLVSVVTVVYVRRQGLGEPSPL